VSFLSRTSALVAAQAASKGRLEVNWMMQAPQVLLALLCVLLGVFPAIAYSLMQRALGASRQGFGSVLAGAEPMRGGLLTGIHTTTSAALFVPLALAMTLGLAFAVAFAVSKLGEAKRRAAAPWLCGYTTEADCHRYVAHNFYGEIKRYFRWVGGAPAPEPHEEPTLKER
jgi:hypothetical protein